MATERLHVARTPLLPAPTPARDRPALAALAARIQRYAGNAPVPAVWRCGTRPCGPGGCADAGLQLSPDLPISHPADPAEQEAEAVADAVMRDAAGPVPEEELEGEAIARTAEGSAPGLRPGLADAIAGARGGGRPLDADVRGAMEKRLGFDLGAVRVHTDRSAGELARQVNASAFTTGADLFFAAGQYRPGEPGGRRLLAHELVHVVQQGRR